MKVLMRCDGCFDFDSVLVSEQERAIVNKLLEKGLIENCEQGSGVSSKQQYRFYPNRFMQAVHWCITGKCNYRCKHCSMSAPEGRYG